MGFESERDTFSLPLGVTCYDEGTRTTNSNMARLNATSDRLESAGGILVRQSGFIEAAEALRTAMLMRALEFMSALFPSLGQLVASSAAERTAGNYVVGRVEGSYLNKWGIYKVTIYYPALQSGENTPPDRAKIPYAAVVFAHGILANKDEYRWIGSQLASCGYVALLFSTPNARSREVDQWSDGISGGITYLNELSSSDTSILRGMVDSICIGVMGHSMGGAAAILATANDSRIKSTVTLAPANPRHVPPTFRKALQAANAVKVPVQIQVGSKDGFTPKDTVHQYYANLPGLAAKEYVEIKGGGHVRFTDIGSRLLSILEPGATLGLTQQHEISQSFFTAWFQYFLHGDVTFEPYLFGANAKNALESGALSALEWVKP
jgi:predicted dienelactone hydrolase